METKNGAPVLSLAWMLICGLGVLGASRSSATTYNFARAAADWNVSSSWSPAGVPGSADGANINGGDVATVGSAAGSVAGLQVANGAGSTGTLAVAAGGTLGLTGFTAFGVASGSAGNLVMTGGTLNNTGLIFGYGANTAGAVTFSGGTINTSGALKIGAQVGTGVGTMVQSGSAHLEATAIALGGTSMTGSSYTVNGGTVHWGTNFIVGAGNTFTVSGSGATIAYTGAANTTSHVFRNAGTLNLMLGATGISPINLGASEVGIATSSTLTVDGSAYTGHATTQITLVSFGKSDTSAGYGSFGTVTLKNFGGWLTPTLVYNPTSIVLSLAAAPVFAVRSYGAIPNQTADAGPAIRAAVAAAIASGGPAQIVFENGSYPIGSVAGGSAWWPKAALVIANTHDLLVVGGGATTLVVTDPTSSGIVVNNCRNIGVMNLAIDYDPAPFVLSTITSITPGTGSTADTFTVQGDSGYPDLVDYSNAAFSNPSYSAVGNAFTLDVDGLPIYSPCQVSNTVVAQTGANTWKLATPAPSGGAASSGLAVGDHFYNRLQSSSAAFSFLFCTGAWADHVTLYAAPSLGFYPALSSGVTLSSCVVEPGPDRLCSTNRDAVHAVANRAGITIRDCSFSGMGDDGINLCSSVALPLSRPSGTVFVFKRNMFTVKVGDLMEAIHPETGAIIGKYTVAAVDNTQTDGCHVTFSGTVGTVALSTDGTAATGDQFYSLSEANNGFLVEGIAIGRHAGREILVSASQGTIQNNTFDNAGAYSIPASSNPSRMQALYNSASVGTQLHFDPSWAEGPIAEQVTIRNNRFAGKSTASPAILILDQIRPQSGGSGSQVSHNAIDIESNFFTDLSAPAVNLGYTSALVLRNNTVQASGGSKPAPTPPTAFLLKGCPGPAASGNASTDAAFTTVLQITP